MIIVKSMNLRRLQGVEPYNVMCSVEHFYAIRIFMFLYDYF